MVKLLSIIKRLEQRDNEVYNDPKTMEEAMELHKKNCTLTEDELKVPFTI